MGARVTLGSGVDRGSVTERLAVGNLVVVQLLI